MSIIIFILVLGLLIFIHELGHFLVAKKSGIRVDEFAIGFPPRLFSFVRGGTRYALNLIPFGGYVKIFGETPDEEATNKGASDSMINKPKYTQALVLVAGIIFNFLLAGLIFFILFLKGVEFDAQLVPYVSQESAVRVQFVSDDSIAHSAGIQVGDTIDSVQILNDEPLTEGNDILDALYSSNKQTTSIVLENKEKGEYRVILNPVTQDSKFGFSLRDAVYIKTGPLVAVKYAFLATGHMIKLTTVGLFQFLGQLFTGTANFKEVAGPVGIVSLVGQAAQTGLNEVLILTALISINLGVLNFMPFPALDGGRLLIVGIEAILKRDLDYKKVALVNLIGFVFLIALMILLTFHDIKNLVS